ncbi:MAG: hypothetical protein ACRC9L_09935 [Brevinema sp.]
MSVIYAQAPVEESSFPVSPSIRLKDFDAIYDYSSDLLDRSNQLHLFGGQLGENGLSHGEISRIEDAIAGSGINLADTDISQAGIFGIIDAEMLYFNNPDALATSNIAFDPKTVANPFLQFLYTKNIANGEELLSHRTNDTTLFNMNGVYNLRIGLQKDANPLPKASFAKRGEIEFLIFSQKTFVPLNSYGQKITLTLYGIDNKLRWVKEFKFDAKQAQQSYLDTKIKRLILHHLLDKDELDELRLLFRANKVIFGRVDGILDSFLFDFRPKTINFYRSFLEYGKSNRYY